METEVEIRGPLTASEYRRLSNFLKKKGRFIKEGSSLAVFFQTKRNNFSLKRDHDEEKFVLKFGHWRRGNRKEVEVILLKGQFENALNLLKGLGFTKGYKAPALRRDFLYRGVKISLKTKAVIGPHFEMETTVRDKKKITRAKNNLLNLAQELKLRVWTEREYYTHTHRMWQLHHPGPEVL